MISEPSRRKIELLVLSDLHLGTVGCHAKELSDYLNSVDPVHLVLNGDIIDIWQFNKRFFPTAHMKVVRQILKMASQGTRVTYLTGNHDEALRRFTGMAFGSVEIKNKLLLDIDGCEAWIFHGDVFDVSMKHARWLAKLGAVGYDTLILLNRLVNFLRVKSGKHPISFSKKIKDSVKSAVSFINDFETTACEIAIENGYDFVVCGHIHQPGIRHFQNEHGKVTYLNSGDWIENLTALEYHQGSWTIYRHNREANVHSFEEDAIWKKVPKPQDLEDFADFIKKVG